MSITEGYLNIFTKDLGNAVEFFKGIGFTFEPEWSNEDAAGFTICKGLRLMVLTENKFSEFTTKDLADNHKFSAHIMALQVDTKDEMNELVDTAITLGADEYREPTDYGFMMSRAFYDLDGNIWEILVMN